MTEPSLPSRPRLLLFTGAGLSVSSGLPAFRMGQGAIWQGWNMDEVSNLLTWKANYEAVHAFYNGRRADLRHVGPNAAHRAIASWQREFDTVLFTTNIDDLLERAGAQDVIHLHGILTRVACTACGAGWEVGYTAVDPADPCPDCEAERSVKPDVTFDNEDSQLYACLDATFQPHAMHPNDVTVVIGSSGYSIDHAIFCWSRPGARVLNNLERSPHIDERLYDRIILAPAAEAVEEIDRFLRERLVG